MIKLTSIARLMICMMLISSVIGTAWAQPVPPPITQPGPLPSPPIDICNAYLGSSPPTASGDRYRQRLPDGATPFPSYAYTQKVVNCLEGSIRDATATLLSVISDYMLRIVGIMIVFALVILGGRILVGQKELTKTVVGFLIRLGLVLAFFYELGGLSDALFDIENELINLVTSGTLTPWQRIDLFLGKLFGVGPGIALFQGLLGILGGALVSSTVGFVLFVAGFIAILDILTFIIRVVFMYLTAYLIMGFLIVLSPFVIPMALFFYTERYFQKWLAMLIAAMITPMMMFAFLEVSLSIFNELIAAIFGVLGYPCSGCGVGTPAACNLSSCLPPDFKAFWRLNQPMFSWLIPGDPSFDQMLTLVTNENLGQSAVQSNMLPQARRALNTNVFNFPGIDFGLNNVGIMQKMVFAFIALWAFASVMKTLVEKIPDIAASIANTVSGIDLQSISIRKMGMETLQNAGIGLVNYGAYQAGLLGRTGPGRTISRRRR